MFIRELEKKVLLVVKKRVLRSVTSMDALLNKNKMIFIYFTNLTEQKEPRMMF